MMQRILLACLSLLTVAFLHAQTGAISGTVLEDGGFEVIGGNVAIVSDDNIGTTTEIDGTYRIEDLAPGTYSVEFSYVGMATKTITDIVVVAGETTTLDVTLAPGLELETVEVVAAASQRTESAVLTIQKESATVLDVISSAQFSKSGDSDVASAVRRVTGVTVEGGKYVYVRGLGDRYSKTSLNGLEIPGLDPNKNTVQMDLFPTNLIDNISVSKTFTPNLPADFAGGYVNVATAEIPEYKTITAGVSLGFNDQTTFSDNFLTYNGSSTDFLGFDDGTRALPELIEGLAPSDFPTITQDLDRLNELVSAFGTDWAINSDPALPNMGANVSFGNSTRLDNGGKLGYSAALVYGRSTSGYTDGTSGVYFLGGQFDDTENLITQIELRDRAGTQEVLWAAMANAAYQFESGDRINFMLMRNQSSVSSARFQTGRRIEDDPDDIYTTQSLGFLERSLTTAQLYGRHAFGPAKRWSLDWRTSFSISEQDEPDLRFFTFRILPNGNFIAKSSDPEPRRFYRNMDQTNWDNKIDIARKFRWLGQSSRVSFGGQFVTRDRQFREQQYVFPRAPLTFGNGSQTGNTDQFLSSDIPNLYFNQLYSAAENSGVYVRSAFEPDNNYDASQNVIAGYAMGEIGLTNNLKFIGGLRLETTLLDFTSFSDGEEQRLLDNLDLLPSVAFNYELNEASKVRASYGRTLARPTFRELSPFTSFDYIGGFLLVGNPDLERSLADNFDLRYEWFGSGERSREMVSVSAFYKQFTNPIERTFNVAAPNGEFTFRNVDQAFLLGTELEVRKSLDFIAPSLSFFSALDVAANVTLIYTESSIDAEELSQIRATNPNADDTRPMFAQSPYVVNFLLSYKGVENGWKANLAFNIIGERIVYVTQGGTPNIYEQPRPALNFNIAKSVTDNVSVKFSAANILGARYQETIEFKDIEYLVQDYQLGRQFSVGVSYKLAD